MEIYNLWQYIPKKRRYQFAILLVVSLFASFAEIVSIAAVIPFLGILLGSVNEMNSLFAKVPGISFNFISLTPFYITLFFCIAVLISGFIRLYGLWFQTRLSHAVGMDLSRNIYKKVLYQPYSVHVSRNSSDVIAGMVSKTNDVVQLVIFPLLSLASSAILSVGILGALLYIDASIAFYVLCGFGLIYIVIMLLTKKRLRLNSRRISFGSSSVIKLIQESLGGIRDVIIDGSQEIFIAAHTQMDSKLRLAQAENQIMASAPRFLIETFGVVLIALVAYKMISADEGAAVMPILGALVLGAQRLLPVVQQIYSSWSNIKGSKGVLEDILSLLNQSVPVNNYEICKGSRGLTFNDKIELKNLSFQYRGAFGKAISAVNIIIPRGSQVGIIGSTGSGKSTLLDLIMGLIEPSHGNLTVDSIEISEENISDWRSCISHVPQAIFLTDGTVAENIAFGIPRDAINMSKVRRAAMLAQINVDIETWPLGYKTMVGERGVRLSGGQRQRIGIARALYKDSALIVLDEATSALDLSTEAKVMNAIRSQPAGGPTLIMAAHRLQTLKNCNLILRVDSGKIICSGSYEDVIGNNAHD